MTRWIGIVEVVSFSPFEFTTVVSCLALTCALSTSSDTPLLMITGLSPVMINSGMEYW